MSERLSPEARRAKYQYNKKYIDAYWERRSRRVETETVETSRSGKNESKTVKHTVEFSVSLPELEIPENPRVSRGNKTNEQYIKALEISNRTLSGENRRLVRLLQKYQEIIEIGVRGIMSNEQTSNQQ